MKKNQLTKLIMELNVFDPKELEGHNYGNASEFTEIPFDAASIQMVMETARKAGILFNADEVDRDTIMTTKRQGEGGEEISSEVRTLYWQWMKSEDGGKFNCSCRTAESGSFQFIDSSSDLAQKIKNLDRVFQLNAVYRSADHSVSEYGTVMFVPDGENNWELFSASGSNATQILGSGMLDVLFKGFKEFVQAQADVLREPQTITSSNDELPIALLLSGLEFESKDVEGGVDMICRIEPGEEVDPADMEDSYDAVSNVTEMYIVAGASEVHIDPEFHEFRGEMAEKVERVMLSLSEN